MRAPFMMLLLRRNNLTRKKAKKCPSVIISKGVVAAMACQEKRVLTGWISVHLDIPGSVESFCAMEIVARAVAKGKVMDVKSFMMSECASAR